MANIYEGALFNITVDDRNSPFRPSLQRGATGNFLNISLQADGNFGLDIGGALASVPQLAQIKAIIEGILGVFGLSQAAPEPPSQFKTVTLDPAVSLATLFGASQGIAFIVQVLKGKVNQIKNYVNSAVTSIQNLFKCLLKNPLLAASIIAKLIRQGWIKIPPGVRDALELVRDQLNKLFGLNIVIFNPLAEFLKKLKEWLKFKWPPPILLPFIPFIPGCSPGFYSGRPPASFIDRPEIVPEVENQFINRPGGFTSRVNINVETIPLNFGPGRNPDLSLTDEQVRNITGIDPYDPFTAGLNSSVLNENLDSTNYPLSTGANNSATRQVQDRLISAGNKVTNDITALSKDISRAGFIPRPSPLDDLLCRPGKG